MSPTIAYLLLGLITLLVLYFAYQNYKSYQKNPSKWLHQYLGETIGEGILHLLK